MVRNALIAAGWLAVVIGVVGIFVPLLPTTPFLLIAAFCFSKASPRFHDWLINHRHLGPPVRAWRERGAIRLKAKLLATFLIALSVGYSAWKFQSERLLLAIVGVTIACVLVFIWSRPSN
jgi:uncharacterized protein